MMFSKISKLLLFFSISAIGLSACNGGDDSSDTPTTTKKYRLTIEDIELQTSSGETAVTNGLPLQGEVVTVERSK